MKILLLTSRGLIQSVDDVEHAPRRTQRRAGGGLPSKGLRGLKFLGNDLMAGFVYQINKAASLRAATLSPTNQPRTETPFNLFAANPFGACRVCL